MADKKTADNIAAHLAVHRPQHIYQVHRTTLHATGHCDDITAQAGELKYHVDRPRGCCGASPGEDGLAMVMLVQGFLFFQPFLLDIFALASAKYSGKEEKGILACL